MVGALHVAEDAQVEPKKLLSAVALGAEREGAVFRTGSTVRGIVVDGDRARGVTVDGEVIEADRVVVAAGSWTTLIPGIRLDANTIYPVRGQMLATHTRPPIFRRIVFGAGGYIVTRPDGRVVDLARLLGPRPFFYADRISIADLAAYAMLRPLAMDSIPGTRGHVERHPALLEFMKRVEGQTGGFSGPSPEPARLAPGAAQGDARRSHREL